ncbi:MAG: P-loop NTPase [bacterium]
MNIKDIRLSGLKFIKEKPVKILVVCSSKGGVGKSTVTFILASLLSEKFRVGVYDFDFTNPSLSTLFNSRLSFYEDYGIVPPEIFKNIFFLSLDSFLDYNYIALRGESVTNIILELLTITNWPEIDYLLIDTPPTITDTLLDIIKFLPDANYIVVSSFSLLSLSSVQRLINVINNSKKEILGVIINEVQKNQKNKFNLRQDILKNFKNIIFLPYIKNIEKFYGKIEKIRKLPILKEFKINIDKYILNPS